jgi:alpha-1,2-mannosyltransferase
VRPSVWTLYLEPILAVIAFSVMVSTIATVSVIADTAPNDFTVFMESARWLRQGVNAYQHPLQSGPGYNLNAPAAVVLFVPFSYLPDAAALRIWTALTIATYVAASYLIAQALIPGRFASVAAAVLLWQPAIISLLLGQISAALMLIVTAAWVADRANRPLRAGLLIGIAIAAKPFLAVFAAYAVWRRSKAFAGGLCLGIAVAVGVGLAAVGVAGYQSWFAAFREVSWTAHVANASLQGVLARTLSVTPDFLHASPLVGRPELVQPLWWAGVALVGIVGLLVLVRTEDRDRVWAIMLIGSLLVSPLGWAYYATVFAGPLLAVALGAPTRARVTIAAGYACLLLPPLTFPWLGAPGVLIFGSIYAWGLVLMFAGVAMASFTESIAALAGRAGAPEGRVAWR